MNPLKVQHDNKKIIKTTLHQRDSKKNEKIIDKTASLNGSTEKGIHSTKEDIDRSECTHQINDNQMGIVYEVQSIGQVEVVDDEIQSCNQQLNNNGDENIASLQTNNALLSKPKRTRNRKQDKSSWPREITKANRQHGKAYQGYQRKDGKHITHDVERPERLIGPRCTSEYCRKSSKRSCNDVDEQKRIQLFTRFWHDMDWDQKAIYVASLVEAGDTERKFVDNSRRSISMKYHLRIDNKRMQVCKPFFMSSLGLKEWMIKNWATNNIDGIIPAKKIVNARRKAVRPPSKKCLADKQKKEFLLKFFDELPKMPSHYCRQRTDKKYLEPNFQSLAQLYRFYCLSCEESNNIPFSNGYFNECFKDLKLGSYQPKKYRCDICESFDKKNVAAELYNKHISQKNRAQKEKIADKEKALAGKAHVFVMDVQAVKLCPVNKSGILYYKTKLKVHNFSLYNLRTKECTNYWWHEGEGGMDASMFVTCIIKHLHANCSDNLPIILWSDGCGYQNRNQILTNALLNYAIQTNKTVEQKFLIKGHTQMEVDNVHALIENKLKGRTIDIPSDYITVTKEARLTKPLKAELLNHKDFQKYDEPCLFWYNSIRPGNKKGDDVVQDIRVLSYKPNGIISFKTNFDDDLKPLPRNTKKPTRSYAELDPLYIEPLKISAKRYSDLQDMKTVLPNTVYAFYDNLSREG